MHSALMNFRTGARSEPGIDLAELHVRFRKRDALDSAYHGVGLQQQIELRFQRNFEGILLTRSLPAVHISRFGRQLHVLLLRQRRSFGNSHSLRGASGHAFTRQLVGRSKTPRAIHHNANSQPERLALTECAHFPALCREIPLTKMHNAHIGIACAATAGHVERMSTVIPHIRSSKIWGAPKDSKRPWPKSYQM